MEIIQLKNNSWVSVDESSFIWHLQKWSMSSKERIREKHFKMRCLQSVRSHIRAGSRGTDMHVGL